MTPKILGITFRQLQAFIAIAESGTFSAAAEALGVSQPSVSRHVKSLEGKCGVLFVRRRGGKVSLSVAGQILYERTPGLLKSISDIAIELGAVEMDNLTVGVASPDYLHGVLKHVVAAFLIENPDHAVDLQNVATEAEGMERLAKGGSDLFYISKARTAHTPMSDCVGTAPASLFCSPALIAQNGYDYLNRKLPMILPSLGSPTEKFALTLLKSLQVGEYTVAARAQHLETSKAMCLRGAGVSLLFDEMVDGELKQGRLVRLGNISVALYRYCYFSANAAERPCVGTFRRFAAQRLSSTPLHTP